MTTCSRASTACPSRLLLLLVPGAGAVAQTMNLKDDRESRAWIESCTSDQPAHAWLPCPACLPCFCRSGFAVMQCRSHGCGARNGGNDGMELAEMSRSCCCTRASSSTPTPKPSTVWQQPSGTSLQLAGALTQRNPLLERGTLAGVEPHARPGGLHQRLSITCALGLALGCAKRAGRGRSRAGRC